MAFISERWDSLPEEIRKTILVLARTSETVSGHARNVDGDDDVDL
jgi:hypothetical protein